MLVTFKKRESIPPSLLIPTQSDLKMVQPSREINASVIKELQELNEDNFDRLDQEGNFINQLMGMLIVQILVQYKSRMEEVHTEYTEKINVLVRHYWSPDCRSFLH